MKDNMKFDIPKHTEPLKSKKIRIAAMRVFWVTRVFVILKTTQNLIGITACPSAINWL